MDCALGSFSGCQRIICHYFTSVLAMLYSFSPSDCDGYLSRAENREPQQALGAEPEQTPQSKTPGLNLQQVRESLLCAGEPGSLGLLQNMHLFR